MKKRLPGIDISKFIFIFIVVGIHTSLLLSFNTLVATVFTPLFDMAVPFFFIVSGYFLFASENQKTERLKDSIKRTTKMYLIWSIIYLPLSVYGKIINEEGVISSIASIIRGWLIVGENYYSWNLWYLLALIVSFIIIYCFVRMGMNYKKIMIVAFVLFLFGIVLDYLNGGNHNNIIIDTYYKIFVTTRNGLFVGFFYVSIGICIYHIKAPKVWPVSIIFLAAYVAYFMVQNVFIRRLLLPLIAVSFFVISVRVLTRTKVDTTVFRNMSTGVYLVHMIYVALWCILFGGERYWMEWIVVCAASALTVLILGKVKIKEKKLIEYLQIC